MLLDFSSLSRSMSLFDVDDLSSKLTDKLIPTISIYLSLAKKGGHHKEN